MTRANIDDALELNDDRHIKMVARLPGADQIEGETRGERVQSLKAHAEQSQLSVLWFVETHQGVSISNRFWIANAVVLEVDTAAVGLEEIAAVDGVEYVGPNVRLDARSDEAVELSVASDQPPATTWRKHSQGRAWPR